MEPQETPEETPKPPPAATPKARSADPWIRVGIAVVIVGALGAGLWRRSRRARMQPGVAHYDARTLTPGTRGNGRRNGVPVLHPVTPLTAAQIRTMGYRAVVYPLTEGSHLGTVRIARIEAPGEQPFINVVLDTLVPHTLRVVRASRLPAGGSLVAHGNYGVYLVGSPPWDPVTRRAVSEAMNELEFVVAQNGQVPLPPRM